MVGNFRILTGWAFSLPLLISLNVQALAPDGTGTPEELAGIVALYTFGGTGNTVQDTSGVGTPLNLTITEPAKVQRASSGNNNYLIVKENTIIHSNGPATKVNQCGAGNEFSIEVWKRTYLPMQTGPARIVTNSSPNEDSTGIRNWSFNQNYDNFAQIHGRISPGNNNGDINGFRSDRGDLELGVLQQHHMIFNRGTVSMYIDRRLIAEIPNRGNIRGWDQNRWLALANEFSYLDTNLTDEQRNQRSWRGELHMVAIYCRAFTREDIQGEAAVQPSSLVVTPQIGAPITADRKKASIIFQRLAGVKTPIDDPRLGEMEALIRQKRDIEAADIAITDHNFYNVTVRDFGARMSTREETVKAPLSDFVAGVIGVTADESDAKDLLTGNFYYRGDPLKTLVADNLVADFLESNDHYEELEEAGYNLGRVLVRVDGQKAVDSTGNAVDHPDPAGVLTSRAFMEAHAIAGTNRRLVEFSFRQFLCIPMEQWADTSNPDGHIGRDVDRFPGGSNSKFQVSCKGCHSGMDALRTAFAEVDFEDDIVKHGRLLPRGGGDLRMDQDRNIPGIALKMNRNGNVYPNGYITRSPAWINNAVRGANKSYFGWRGSLSGVGVGAFGKMMSESEAFSRCMVKRVYRSVCKREVTAGEAGLVRALGSEFERQNYNLKWLFKKVAVNRACIGKTEGF